jgi:hypothetical protein
VAGIRIGGSSFKDVQRWLGAADSIRPSRDESAPKVLCYILGQNRLVVFESSPLATVEGEVTAISMLERSYVPFAERCRTSENEDAALRPKGAALGAARRTFEVLVGREYCYRDANITEWNFEQLDQDWSTLSGLHAYFFEDKLMWWHLYSVRSR